MYPTMSMRNILATSLVPSLATPAQSAINGNGPQSQGGMEPG